MTVEEHLASIDTSIALMDQRLEAHTEADEINFNRLSAQLSTIDSKVDELRLADAARKAVVVTDNKRAGLFGGGIAAVLVAFVEGLKYFVHG